MAGMIVLVGAVLAAVFVVVGMGVGPMVMPMAMFVVMGVVVGVGVLMAVHLPAVVVFMHMGVLVFMVVVMLMGMFAFHCVVLLFVFRGAVAFTASGESFGCPLYFHSVIAAFGGEGPGAVLPKCGLFP